MTDMSVIYLLVGFNRCIIVLSNVGLFTARDSRHKFAKRGDYFRKRTRQ